MPETDLLMFPSELPTPNAGQNSLFDFGSTPNLNMGNYSGLIPQTDAPSQFDYESGPGMFPEEMPGYDPGLNPDGGIPVFDQPSLGEQMFHPEMMPADIPAGFEPSGMPGLGEQMFPEDIPQEMQDEIPIELQDTSEIEQNEYERDNLLKLLESAEGLDQNTRNIVQEKINSLDTEIQQQKQKVDMLLSRKGAVVSPGASSTMDKYRVVNASSGYEDDLRNFLAEIKNPPMWRVLD